MNLLMVAGEVVQWPVNSSACNRVAVYVIRDLLVFICYSYDCALIVRTTMTEAFYLLPTYNIIDTNLFDGFR